MRVSWCWWQYQLAGWSNTSGRLLSSVTIAAHFVPTNCRSGLWFEYGGASCSPACGFGSQDQTRTCSKHDVVVGCRCFVEHWRSGWLTGWLYLWRYRQVIAGRMRCSVVSNGPEIIQNESDSTELLGSRSTGHVCGFGLCRVGFLQELNHGQFDLQGPPAVMQE